MFKKKLLLAVSTLSMLVSLSVSTVAFGSTYPDGYFDEMDGDTIIGWGWDDESPNTAIPVEISIKNKSTGEIVKEYNPIAATYRSDLEEFGIGNGRHGFTLDVDWDMLPAAVYEIEGEVNGKDFMNTQTYANGDVPLSVVDMSRDLTPLHATAPLTATAISNSNLISLGTYKTTAYCSCTSCSGKWGNLTSTGVTARSNHTIAVDPGVISYGSKIMIDGIVYTAEDKGGGVNGKHIDIYFDSHSAALRYGRQYVEVFLVK